MILFCFELLKKHNHRKTDDRSEGIDAVLMFTNDKDHDKHYLLVDDVITTATGGLFQSFIENPGARVSIVCMAMAQSNFSI
jgi:predicted amidophosphoribosyltransferase